ncbi:MULTISPECIES: hypothetical protein [unclassified Pseudomonas]|uniref:hypothetical protein n=1 Tax=unclassified Pseudomonas TaxID=196821 RepID=UPI001F5AC404|nr:MULTISPECIES: hypothetical protein [unclassified Pseudomonas]
MNMQTLRNAGTPDLAFGVNGRVILTIPDLPFARISAVAIGPDRKIYCVGKSDDFTDPNPTYFLGRFNDDGTEDREFGDAGFTRDAYPDARLQQVESFTFQPDGKILIFATVYNKRGGLVPAFSRYDTKGRLDTTFGSLGQTVLNIELAPPGRAAFAVDRRNVDGNAARPKGVEVLPDGKILASHHYLFDFHQSHGLIIRLNADGKLDTDFNQIGYITVIHPDYKLNATILRDVIVQEDGKYLGCGNVYNDSDNPSSGMFVRYDTDGALDKNFGTGGFVTITDAVRANLIEGMVLQPNRRILGFGGTLNNVGVMVSIEPDGAPNIQFNGGKPLYTGLEPDSITTWTSATIQKNGRIVVAGGLGVPGRADIVVARFIDAQFDREFNEQGWLRTHLENGVQMATGLTLQEDGKILICANLPGLQVALLRYHA